MLPGQGLLSQAPLPACVLWVPRQKDAAVLHLPNRPQRSRGGCLCLPCRVSATIPAFADILLVLRNIHVRGLVLAVGGGSGWGGQRTGSKTGRHCQSLL